MSEQMNRREFLGVSAAGAGAVLLGSHVASAQGNEENWPPKMPPAKIYKVYIGRTGGIYLSRPTAEVDKFNRYLANLESKLGDVKFIGGDMVPETDVEKVLPKLAEADGVLMFHLCGHGGDAPLQAMSKIVDKGLPTVVFSQPFSGHGWMYFPPWAKQGKRVVLLLQRLERSDGGRHHVVQPPPRRVSRVRGPQGRPRTRPSMSRLAGEMIPSPEETPRSTGGQSQGRRGRGPAVLDQQGQEDRRADEGRDHQLRPVLPGDQADDDGEGRPGRHQLQLHGRAGQRVLHL
jgi:hypothetical protein